MSVIERPEVDFDAVNHAYSIDGERMLGVSTVAKIGQAEDAFSIASAWGFRVGYEGAFDVADELIPLDDWPGSKDGLREELKKRGLTPWGVRDKAAERGSWVHDGLEALGQDGDVPDMDAFEAKHGAEARGHMGSVLAWFLYFRPSFVALEVQIASRTHGFAGRYDVRCLVDSRKMLACIDPLRQDVQAGRIRYLAERHLPALGLVDLKTSKGIYPTSHFPQLEGYEGGGVEMGFPATDFRAVLNTWPSGEHVPARDFMVSWSRYEDFLAYLSATRAIRAIKDGDPQAIRDKRIEAALLANLPAVSRDLAKLGFLGTVPEFKGLDSRTIGGMLGRLRKRGLVEQDEKTKTWRAAAS